MMLFIKNNKMNTKLLDKKLLELNDNRLVIPKNLWYISNSVIVGLIDCEVTR